MTSLHFLERFMKHIKRIETKQLVATFTSLAKDYSVCFTILDNLEESLIIFDQQLVPSYTNAKAQNLFFQGETPSQQPFNTVVPFKPLLDMIENFIQDKSTYRQKEIFIEGFYLRIWDVQIKKIDFMKDSAKKNTPYYLLSVKDITSYKKDLNQKQLKKNILSMESLAASLAHEIKNPLEAIHLHLNLVNHSMESIKKESQIKEMKDYIRIIEEEVFRLSTITSDFLKTIRPLSLKLKKIILIDLIRDSIKILSKEMQDKNISFRICEQESLPNVLGDASYLRSVFLNLIKNAIESFESRSFNREPFIILCLEENSPFVEITIQDNGAGIAPKNLDKIFEPYFTTKSYGSGIGLATVHKIIHEHKGDIQIRSVVNEGTICKVFLPSYKESSRKFLENS